MSRLPTNVIELNRTFLLVPESVAGLDAEATLRAALHFDRSESWSDLLSHPYVVVLGEAGTGKSTEFMFRVHSLLEQGQFAVFVELSDLATEGLDISIDVDDEARLEQWREGDQDGIFFLDSLDEAKLRALTLRHALRRLRRELKDEWSRVRLVVSCRVSDWMAQTDRDELRGVAHGGPSSDVHIVQLAPLDTGQVEQLARLVGVTDVGDFMAAIVTSYAQVFIERPLDVDWIGAYWVRHKRIGSLRELIADNVREKLKERPGRPSTLSPNKAEAGLQVLAGVAILNNCWAFLVPDESLDAQRTIGAVDPQEFLPDWSADEIGELLRRSVFDEATYGRVRLHHRSVQEFLAAKWLDGLIANGLAHAQVVEIFFQQEGEEQVIPAHLVPVAAWLALWTDRLRQLLIREAPSLLIGHGDPSGFTDEERRQILRSLTRSYEGRDRMFESFDHASLQRFSSPALSDQVETLLAASETPVELASILFQLVEHGQIASCADTCIDLALDHSRLSQVRFSAIRAAAAVGTDSHRAALIGLMSTESEWNHDSVGAFARALYPDPLNVSGLIQLLTQVKPTRRNLTTSLDFFLEYEIPNKGTVELRSELLHLLLGILWVLDADTAEYTVPAAQQWLLPMLGKLVSSILDELPEEIEHFDDVITALDLFRWCNEQGLHVRHGLDNVKKAVARHPEIRRELFWRRVAEHKRSKGATPTRFFELPYSHEIFGLSATDRQWLATDARSRSEVRERLLAFDSLTGTPDPDGDQTRHLSFLGDVAQGIPELTRRLDRMLNRPAPAPHPNTQRWERVQRARDLAIARQNTQNREELGERIEQIRDASDFGVLHFLYERTNKSHGAYGEVEVESLATLFGEEITEAAITGWRAFWRTFEPPLPHEHERRGSVPNGAIVGLLGLNIDFKQGLKASSLTSDEARIAARYALWELSSFPAWLAELTKFHWVVVAETLLPAIVADLNLPNEGTHDVLAKLPRAHETVRSACAPLVADHLREQEPPMVQSLAYAFDVVIDCESLPAKEFAALADERCRASLEQPERFATWWEGWLALKPLGALEYLEKLLGEVDSGTAYDLVLQICDRIHRSSETHAVRSFHARKEPQVLMRLIPVVHEYIKPDDDIEHERSYTPGPRDHAQNIRYYLDSWLTEIPGAESVQALRHLADDPRLAHIRDWLLHRAEQRLVANASATPTDTIKQLGDLCRKHGTEACDFLGSFREESQMGRFDVGIITMKEEEYEAFLDKFEPSETFEGKNRTYDVASVPTEHGDCRVAITRCVQQGNAYAQSAATEMLTDISPRFLLVVGIAGGVPTTDFCLGDVVVSNYIQDLTLEDTGTKPGNERYNALGGPLHPSAGRIVERLRAVERSSPDWNSAESVSQRRPSLEGEHATDDEDWNSEIDKAIAHHAQREIPIGTAQKIASSDRLVKDPDLLKKWRQVLKAVAAVEMESAGVYVPCQRNDVPFIAIRGISDIVGLKRNEAWTLYACHTAAAYTRMLVGSGLFLANENNTTD